MRPTKFNDRIVKKTEDYLRQHDKQGDQVPSIVGLASFLNISKSTLLKWKGEPGKEQFSDTLERIKDRQHLMLINKGLTGEFNASITKLMLHNFGYSDRQQINEPDKQPIKVYLRTQFD